MYVARSYEFDFRVDFVFKCKNCGCEEVKDSGKKPSKLVRTRWVKLKPTPRVGTFSTISENYLTTT